jgi:hypothetical protein
MNRIMDNEEEGGDENESQMSQPLISSQLSAKGRAGADILKCMMARKKEQAMSSSQNASQKECDFKRVSLPFDSGKYLVKPILGI